MLKEREDDEKSIPKSLLNFIDTPHYFNFMNALLEYCKELFRLENKQQVLE